MPPPYLVSPFRILGPQPPLHPVLLAVPHAGWNYSADLIANARVPLNTLRRLEDRRADLVVEAAVKAGFTAIVADIPRAYIDLNRAETDCDPAAIDGDGSDLQPSQRARGGLGLLPHRLSPEGDLWRSRPTARDLAHRIDSVHRPWHAAIDGLLAAIRAGFGAAVLLDIHSMPPPPDGTELALGDRFGLTAQGAFADNLLAVAEGFGLKAHRNHPYAGAFTIERHASVSRGVQALQVEIARDLYLNADGSPAPEGVARMGRVVAALAARAAHSCGPRMLSVAAE